VKQQLYTLTEQLRSSSVLVGVLCFGGGFVFWWGFCDLVGVLCFVGRCLFVIFLLVIALSVFLRFKTSDYPF
jgi:hypothetical protein